MREADVTVAKLLGVVANHVRYFGSNIQAVEVDNLDLLEGLAKENDSKVFDAKIPYFKNLNDLDRGDLIYYHNESAKEAFDELSANLIKQADL